jgi:prepilin-type N-terminal cleavage/methylation domain-containing protein
MRCALTGIPAALQLLLKSARSCRGFTLIEALVALALVLAFAATLGPYMFHARRIVSGVDDRIAAQILLRSLLDSPFERASAPAALREGKTAGLRWRIRAEPMFIEKLDPPKRGISSPLEQRKDAAPEQPSWSAFRVIASVSWGSGSSVSAETLRLGRTE